MRDGGVYVSALGSNACCFSCAGVMANPCSHATVTPLAPVSPFVPSRHANRNTTLCCVFYLRDFFLKNFEAHSFVTGWNLCLLSAAKYRLLMLMKKAAQMFCGFTFWVKGIMHIMYTPSCRFKPVWHSFFIITSMKISWVFWFVYQHSSKSSSLPFCQNKKSYRFGITWENDNFHVWVRYS